MIDPSPTIGEAQAALADRTIALVERWLVEARDEPVDADARRLAGMLRDPNGLAFTTGFIDGVIIPRTRASPRATCARSSRWSPGSCRCRCAPSPGLARGWRRSLRTSSSRSPGACCGGWSATWSSMPRARSSATR